MHHNNNCQARLHAYRVCREQLPDKLVLGVLQQALVLSHHKILVFVKEVVCLVCDWSCIMIQRECSLAELGTLEAWTAFADIGLIQLLSKVLVGSCGEPAG